MNIQYSTKQAYMRFDRNQWSALRKTEPLPLTEKELSTLKGIDEDLSLDEVATIYLPLSRLLNYYITSNISHFAILTDFLETKVARGPYIISIAGSVAVGKSTTARVLQALLKYRFTDARVELVTTDGFLWPNHVLKERNIMNKKGFPVSYDIKSLLNFVAALKAGEPVVRAPVYSHLIYDIVPNETQLIEKPDILILEGLNVLQTNLDYPQHPARVFVSDFVDFSIYVDAEEKLLTQWYISRFLKLRKSAFSDPHSYFHHYSQISESQSIEIAKNIWKDINSRNLHENILPTRERANLILVKGENHLVKEVYLRK